MRGSPATASVIDLPFGCGASALAAKHGGRALRKTNATSTFGATATVSLSLGLRTPSWVPLSRRSMLRFCEVWRRGPTGLLEEHCPCRC